jgi:hypothetical protein
VVDCPAHWEHRIRHHPDEFWMEDNNKIKKEITRDYYVQLTKKWKNKHHKNVIHARQTSRGDGGINWTIWDKQRETMVVLTTTHTYENRIQASHSVFKFPAVKDASGLFEYPEIVDETNVPSILGVSPDDPANRFLCVRNAELGNRKQIRIWILVYHDKSIQYAIDQESMWQGGNKNEMVVCIGTNATQDTKWCYVFSWTEQERLKVDVKNYITSQQKTDLMQIAKYVSDESEKRFTRKQFKDFSYLTVDPPQWGVILVYVMVFFITIGLCVWSVCNNKFTD